jgi:hypothetical protein
MKGQYKMLADIFMALLVVALCVAIYFAFVGFYVIIKTIVSSAEEDRNAMNLAQVLISSDKIIYLDEKRSHRAILDEEKLDNLDLNDLFSEISYPSYKYSFTVTNLDSGKSWKFGEDFDTKIRKTFTINIKSGDEIQLGNLSLIFKKV